MQLDFPIAKAEYLLNHSDDQGEGGDKQKYWRQVLGFDLADELRQAILAEISPDMLKPHGKHPYGDRYLASIQVDSPTGRSQAILTVWLVRFGEDIARLITAYPDRKGGKNE